MNAAAIRNDPVLAEVKDRLHAMYGARLKRVVLYGSRARGDHGPDSDYDIAAFIQDYDGKMDEVYRLADVGHDYLMERGIDLSIKPFAPQDWNVDTHFMRHLHRDAIDL